MFILQNMTGIESLPQLFFSFVIQAGPVKSVDNNKLTIASMLVKLARHNSGACLQNPCVVHPVIGADGVHTRNKPL